MKKRFYFIGIIHSCLLFSNQELRRTDVVINKNTIDYEGQFFINPDKLYLIKQAWSVNTSGWSPEPSYYSIVINGQKFKGVRPWALRWNMVKDALDYQGKKVVELGCCMGLVHTFLKRYRNVTSAVGVDGPDYFLQVQGSPHRLRAARRVAQAFEVSEDFIQVDFNRDKDYEGKIGYDYDIVFCMSLLHWIHDKDRFMRYLSKFQHIIFEGHNVPSVEIARFKRYGFSNYTILGKVDRGRTVIHFYK